MKLEHGSLSSAGGGGGGCGCDGGPTMAMKERTEIQDPSLRDSTHFLEFTPEARTPDVFSLFDASW